MSELNWAQRVLVIAGGFICYFLADGYTYSVGVLYPSFLKAFNSSDTSTAVLPGLLYAVPQLASPLLCQPLSVYGYSSGAAWAACILCFSCICSSFAFNLGVLYFTFGVMTSIGLQLTYSSAIMAVTAAFKDSHFFGLAVGLTMCGSGIGSFVSVKLMDHIVETWTWRGALFIEAGILLNALVAAACFHHVDAIEFRYNVVGLTHGQDAVEHKERSDQATQQQYSRPTIRTLNGPDSPDGLQSISKCQTFSWSTFRYLLWLPSRLRFQNVILLPSKDLQDETDVLVASEVSGSGKLASNVLDEDRPGFKQFLHHFTDSMKQLISRDLWCNPRLLCYILANGFTGAGTVVPYTYVAHHAQLAFEHVTSESVEADSAWLLSLIGLGALFGQIAFGLITFQFGDLRNICCRNNHAEAQYSPKAVTDVDEATPRTTVVNSTVKHRCPSRLIILFLGTLLWNSVCTLAIAGIPLQGQIDSSTASDEPLQLFHLAAGRGLAAACFLVGISNGGIYVLYPQILVEVAGDKLWPAALSLFLVVNGIMNLTGTVLAANLFTVTGSYHVPFILSGIFPLIGVLVFLGQQCVACSRRSDHTVTANQSGVVSESVSRITATTQ